MDDEEKQIKIPNPAVGFQTINQQLVSMSPKNETDSPHWILPSQEVGGGFLLQRWNRKLT